MAVLLGGGWEVGQCPASGRQAFSVSRRSARGGEAGDGKAQPPATSRFATLHRHHLLLLVRGGILPAGAGRSTWPAAHSAQSAYVAVDRSPFSRAIRAKRSKPPSDQLRRPLHVLQRSEEAAGDGGLGVEVGDGLRGLDGPQEEHADDRLAAPVALRLAVGQPAAQLGEPVVGDRVPPCGCAPRRPMRRPGRRRPSARVPLVYSWLWVAGQTKASEPSNRLSRSHPLPGRSASRPSSA